LCVGLSNIRPQVVLHRHVVTCHGRISDKPTQEETVATVRFVETYGMDATIGRALGPRGAQD
jgi:hypothetical protein